MQMRSRRNNRKIARLTPFRIINTFIKRETSIRHDRMQYDEDEEYDEGGEGGRRMCGRGG